MVIEEQRIQIEARIGAKDAATTDRILALKDEILNCNKWKGWARVRFTRNKYRRATGCTLDCHCIGAINRQRCARIYTAIDSARVNRNKAIRVCINGDGRTCIKVDRHGGRWSAEQIGTTACIVPRSLPMCGSEICVVIGERFPKGT